MFDKKTLFAIAGIAIVVAVLLRSSTGFFGLVDSDVEKIKKDVKTLLELSNPGANVEIVMVQQTSGLYKILAKISGLQTTYLEIYVTKDGKYLTQNLINIEDATKRILNMKNFVDCLYNKGVRIYGVSNRQQSPQGFAATSLQLNLLGIYSTKLFVSCDGQNLKKCQQMGITQVPSIVYQGRVYNGTKAIPWFEQLTGCKLNR